MTFTTFVWLSVKCGISTNASKWYSHTRSVPKVMRMIKKKKLLNIHAITVYPLQSRLLAIEYSDSSIAATLHSNGGSLHLRCRSKPSSQLPGRFQLSQNYILWGGFWAWGIKRNCMEPSQGCTVGGEALWYYFESKIPTQRMMCDLAHCRSEGTTCLQFHCGHA